MSAHPSVMSYADSVHSGWSRWNGANMPDSGLRQSVLIIGDTDVSRAWATLVADAKARLLDCVPLAQATAQLASIIDVDVVIADCRGDARETERVLNRLDLLAHRHGTAVLLIVDAASVDLAFALATGPQMQLLYTPREADVALALAAALAVRRMPPTLHDPARDGQPPEIERLGVELERLSRLIEGLLREGRQPAQNGFGSAEDLFEDAGPESGPLRSPKQDYRQLPPLTGSRTTKGALDAQQVRCLLRVRRMRDQMMPDDLFADPAWDILLDLMAARLEGIRVSVSSLCIAAAVPPTTALRWIRQLTETGLLERHADARDGRRVFIALSDEGARLVERWFHAAAPWLRVAAGG